MTRVRDVRRPRPLLSIAALLPALALACSSGDHAPASSGEMGGGGAAGSGGGKTDGSGIGGGPADSTAPDTGLIEAALPEGSTIDFGSLAIEDVAAGPCGKPGGNAATIAAAADVGTGFAHAGVIGSRRFAFGAESGVLVTFSPDGTQASSVVSGPAAAASDGTALAALLLGPTSVDVQFYGESGAATGAPVHAASVAADAPAVATGPSQTLAVYRSDGAVLGKIVENGAVTASVSVGQYSGGEGRCDSAVVWDGSAFAIVTTAHQHDGRTKTTWTHVSKGGRILYTHDVFLAGGTHVLFDLVRIGTGYAALFGEGNPTSAVVIVTLDTLGYALSPAHRLSGTALGFGLATNGTDLAVAAELEDGRAAVRAFDAAFAPVGPWICVDDSAPGSGFYAQAGVTADGSGWGMVARMTDLSVSYRRTDRVGTGSP